MSGVAALVLLILAFVVGLALIPFGLPGLWLMVLALIGYAVFSGFQAIGWITLVVVVLMAIAAEVAEAWLGFGFARRFGGSSRAGWGAVFGGLVGAVVGTPLPLVGNIVGAFVGAFVGAALMEKSRGSQLGASLQAGWGAVLGRAAAAAIKIGIGLTIAIIGLYAAIV